MCKSDMKHRELWYSKSTYILKEHPTLPLHFVLGIRTMVHAFGISQTHFLNYEVSQFELRKMMEVLGGWDGKGTFSLC